MVAGFYFGVAFNAGIPVDKLISIQCPNGKFAAEQERIKFKSTGDVDFLIVGTRVFVQETKNLIHSIGPYKVAGVAVQHPGLNQFATSSAVFYDHKPMIRIFQNSPFIWTNYFDRLIKQRQYIVQRNVPNASNPITRSLVLGSRQLNMIPHLLEEMSSKCNPIAPNLPTEMYWSTFLPEHELRRDIRNFLKLDTSSESGATLWVHDKSWIPRDTKPDTKSSLVHFYNMQVPQLGIFVDKNNLRQQVLQKLQHK